MSDISPYYPPPQPATLAQWIGNALQGMGRKRADGETPASCTALVMVHVYGQSETEIHPVVIGGRKYDDAAINALARTFESMAVTDAQSKTGKQHYEVRAVFEDQETRPARYGWKVNGHLVNTAGDNSTEAPTAEGRMMQRMRHDETYSTMLVTTMANSLNQSSHFTKMVMDYATRVTAERNDLYKSSMELAVEKLKHDREHELKLMELQNQKELWEKVAKIAPALMNTITGKEIVPQSMVDTTIVEMMAEHIGPEEIKLLGPLLGKLPPEAVGVLMTRLEAIQKDKNAAEERMDRTLGKMNTKQLAESEISSITEKH